MTPDDLKAHINYLRIRTVIAMVIAIVSSNLFFRLIFISDDVINALPWVPQAGLIIAISLSAFGFMYPFFWICMDHGTGTDSIRGASINKARCDSKFRIYEYLSNARKDK